MSEFNWPEDDAEPKPADKDDWMDRIIASALVRLS